MATKTPAKKTVKRAPKADIEEHNKGPKFDALAFQDDTVDEIERKMGLETTSVEDIEPMSTGMLSHDMLLGGGIRPSWYTSAGAEQSAKTTSVLTIMGSAVKHKIGLVHLSDYEGSSGSSGPYVRSVLQSQGLKMTIHQIFGKKGLDGKWEIKPRVRYRSSSALEDFFDYMHSILSILPDKRRINGKWWLVYEDNKVNKAKFADFADPKMGKRYGSGIYIPAEDGNLQAIFFVDSYPAMLPAEQDKDEANNSLALQARAFSKHIPRVKGRMAKKMVAVIGVNQLRAVPMAMYGPSESEPGGNALKLYSDARMRHTSRSLSAAPFKAVADKNYSEIEKSATVEGGLDKYRYIHLKMIKNKLSNPGRQSFTRIWIEDATGTARGLDPVFDTIYYLKETGQLTGKRAAFKLNLVGLGPAKKTVTWHQLKQWVLCDKETMTKISTSLGYKPMSLRAFCFKQMSTGVSEDLYNKVKNAAKERGETDDDSDED